MVTLRVCKPDMVYILDRGHGLHFYSLSSVPAFGWGNLFRAFIEDTEYVKTVTQLPVVLIHGLESHGLFGQDFRDVEKLAPPLDLAVRAPVPNGDSRLVF